MVFISHGSNIFGDIVYVERERAPHVRKGAPGRCIPIPVARSLNPRRLPAAATVRGSSPYCEKGTSLVKDIQYTSAIWAACGLVTKMNVAKTYVQERYTS